MLLERQPARRGIAIGEPQYLQKIDLSETGACSSNEINQHVAGKMRQDLGEIVAGKECLVFNPVFFDLVLQGPCTYSE